MKQVVPAPQAKLRFFLGEPKKISSEAKCVVANLFGRDRKPARAAKPKPAVLRAGVVPARGAREKRALGKESDRGKTRQTARRERGSVPLVEAGLGEP